MSLNTAYIGLGANLGDALQTVRDGWDMLGAVPGISLGRLSPPYRTEPVDMASEHWFINAAGEVHTSLRPEELLRSLHDVEALFGRTRKESAAGYQDRPLDFDLLLYAQEVIRSPGMTVPHPAMHGRLFVLLPLCDIAPELIHPVFAKNIRNLLKQLVAAGSHPVVERVEWPGGGAHFA